MIEVLSSQRCTGCNICVRVCPTNVFEEDSGDAPVIARHEDCQTCYQCEAYCPADAIFVAPLRTSADEGSEWRDEARLIETGQLGLYRKRVGWGEGPHPELPSDDEFANVMKNIQRRLVDPPRVKSPHVEEKQ
jgi:NAD-dependent dihydropyrimidine dehydrogenase PreA subunit